MEEHDPMHQVTQASRKSGSDQSNADEPVVLIPIYNDWHACSELLRNLDRELAKTDRMASVLLVDDGSIEPASTLLLPDRFHALTAIRVLTLRRNLGHQRAICVGLSYIEQETTHSAIVVMDGDGQDAPSDVPRLLLEMETEKGIREPIVFAERARRSENVLFRALYWLYRMVHRVLTGRSVRVGNFSVIPRSRLSGLVLVPELWSHYAAAVFVSGIPYQSIPTNRADRIAGDSTMDLVRLVTHGLSAITVFGEHVSVRMLLATLLMVGLLFAGGSGVAVASLMSPWTAPGWVVLLAGLLMILVVLSIMFSLLFSFMVLFHRKNPTMIPTREYSLFIDKHEVVSSNQGVRASSAAEG